MIQNDSENFHKQTDQLCRLPEDRNAIYYCDVATAQQIFLKLHDVQTNSNYPNFLSERENGNKRVK